MPPPTDVATVVSPRLKINRENESKKRKASSVVHENVPLRPKTMSEFLLRTKVMYVIFLSSTQDAGVGGYCEISTVNKLQNLKVLTDNLEEQKKVLNEIDRVEIENVKYTGLLERMKRAGSNPSSIPLTIGDINLVIKDTKVIIEKNLKQIWTLQQNLNSIVETLENEICDMD